MSHLPIQWALRSSTCADRVLSFPRPRTSPSTASSAPPRTSPSKSGPRRSSPRSFPTSLSRSSSWGERGEIYPASFTRISSGIWLIADGTIGRRRGLSKRPRKRSASWGERARMMDVGGAWFVVSLCLGGVRCDVELTSDPIPREHLPIGTATLTPTRIVRHEGGEAHGCLDGDGVGSSSVLMVRSSAADIIDNPVRSGFTALNRSLAGKPVR